MLPKNGMVGGYGGTAPDVRVARWWGAATKRRMGTRPAKPTVVGVIDHSMYHEHLLHGKRLGAELVSIFSDRAEVNVTYNA